MSYDYVVVGAGSAGCVLAARLAEDPDVSVCLIEAGPLLTDDTVRVPLFGGQLLRTRFDWDYDTHEEPQLDGRRLFLPRGRLIGGSSSLNGMIYIRGNPRDYDEWRQPGWSYSDMLPYFRRSEDNERGESHWHGIGGPLGVSEGRSRNPIAKAFIDAAVQAGYPANDDFNGERQEGFGWFQVTQRDGERSSTADFLAPASGRNLTVLTNVQVHRVTFTGLRATGVVGSRLDEVVEVRAEREVILCAGAYNSPQLLMLSGIGDAVDLAALGIRVLIDQPEVGRNLQDHPAISLAYGHSRPVSLLTAGDPESVRLYAEQRSGPLSSNAPEAGGFVRSDDAQDVPNLQYFVVPLLLMGGLMVPSHHHGVTIGGCVLDARSRGRVVLASAVPTAKPRILHNYYGDDGYDLSAIMATVRIGLQIARQPAMKRFTEQAYQVPASESDADLRAFARRYTQTQFHPAGTCAMGTVLDAQLRVRGVTGLRVADGSIMPTLVRGNTNAPVIAIAERAADLIRGKSQGGTA